MRSLVCIEAAHDPAAAGPRVQIPPPQPNFFNERLCFGGAVSSGKFLHTRKHLPPHIVRARFTLCILERKNPA